MKYMIDRIADEYLGDESKYPEEYVDSIYNKIATVIQYTNLSPRLQMDHIDVKSLPPDYKKLYKSFPDILKSNHSVYVRVPDFTNTSYLSALFIESTILNCLKSDVHLPILLYIDTSTLLADFSMLMDRDTKNLDIQMTLGNSTEIIYDLIYRADFVFWDKFDLSVSNYASKKLFDIISVRYNKCLNNMYFCKSSIDGEILEHFSLDLVQCMDFSSGMYDLTKLTKSKSSLIQLIKEDAIW